MIPVTGSTVAGNSVTGGSVDSGGPGAGDVALVWLNGDLVPRDLAMVNVYDRGFTSGDGVFETIKVVQGQPFALTRHLQRLAASATIVGFPLVDEQLLREAVAEVLSANRSRLTAVARLRITVTAGSMNTKVSAPSRSTDGLTVVMTADPQPPHPESLRVLTVAWPHNERGPLVGAKTTSYADNLAILEQVRARGADEALMADTQGRLCEATTANVIVAVGGELITPSLATGCLGGVTRALLIEWGIVAERDIEFGAIAGATEMMLSSSTRNLIPVRQCDDQRYEAPGPLGAAAIRAFEEQCAVAIDP